MRYIITDLDFMATLNMRLDDELEKRMAREASLEKRTRSELARAAIESYLAQCERRRFQAEILRAARARGDSEAIAIATEAIYTDNEALDLPLMRLTRDEASAVEKSLKAVTGLS